MFDPAEMRALGGELQALTAPLELFLHPEPETELSAALGLVAEVLATKAPDSVRLAERPLEEPPARPALELRRAGRGILRWLALPEEQEAAPFREIVLDRVEATPVEEEVRTLLAQLSEQARIMVFVSPFCPHCPNAVRAAALLTTLSNRIHVDVVDAQRFEALAAQHGVQSAPTTLLDGELRWTGVVSASELARAVLSRGTPGHERAVFRSRVQGGGLDAAAESLLHGGAAEHFLAEWRESTTSTRIGLMLLAEKVLALDESALHAVGPGIAALLTSEDAALRGDTADLLGQMRYEAAREALAKLTNDPNPDVAEIASEALEELD